MASLTKDPLDPSKLPTGKRIIYRLFGSVYLEHRQLEGWSGPLSFHLVKCPVHGPYEDYPHGYDQAFRCPKCWRGWSHESK